MGNESHRKKIVIGITLFIFAGLVLLYGLPVFLSQYRSQTTLVRVLAMSLADGQPLSERIKLNVTGPKTAQTAEDAEETNAPAEVDCPIMLDLVVENRARLALRIRRSEFALYHGTRRYVAHLHQEHRYLPAQARGRIRLNLVLEAPCEELISDLRAHPELALKGQVVLRDGPYSTTIPVDHTFNLNDL